VTFSGGDIHTPPGLNCVVTPGSNSGLTITDTTTGSTSSVVMN
jgi:hypothetical protein